MYQQKILIKSSAALSLASYSEVSSVFVFKCPDDTFAAPPPVKELSNVF